MRVTSKGRYGLKAMLDLVENAGDDKLVKSREIAERKDIPLKYLEQIINILKKHKLVLSVRGSEGGYRLARPATSITVFEILQALEGEMSIIDKNDSGWAQGQGLFWQELENQMVKLLSITLSDFSYNTQQSGQGHMYYI